MKTKFTFWHFSMKTASILLLTACIISSCKKDNSESVLQEKASKDEQLYNTLLKSNVKQSDIQEIGEYYLVEGDLLFKKNKTDLNKVSAYFKTGTEGALTAERDHSLARTKEKTASANIPTTISQWHTPTIVSSSKVETITYSMALPTSWINSTLLAMEKWTTIPNVKINFYRADLASPTQNANNIYFREDGGTLPNNVIAAAEFPSSDNAGFQIRVNLDFQNNYNVSDAGKLYNIVHEIGHCIGLRHSNWQSIGESQSGSVLIPGTPQADNSSVMNGGTALNTWNGFSSYDVIAAQVLYPYGAYDKWLTAPEGKYSYIYSSGYSIFLSNYNDNVQITWNQNLVSTSGVNLALYQNGQLVQTLGTNIPNTGSFSYPIGNHLQLSSSGHSFHQVQLKITSSNNTNISDFTSLFYILID